ncbi:MAG: cytochrome c3 family protein [Thermodesulfobacteriota bacterium]
MGLNARIGVEYRQGVSGQRNPASKKILFASLVFSGFLFTTATPQALITGPCSNCHTMHNSQDGEAMATLGGESGANPNPYLTRGSCVGCHAMGENSKIKAIGGTEIPQVMHTDGTGDLAGGNFAYMLGLKGSGASDAKGHNVIDFAGEQDDALYAPPGGIVQFFHDSGGIVNDTNLTCAGTNGCHGYRYSNIAPGSGLKAMGGAHHANVDGKCDVADTPANSYRFLFSVRGLENQNPTGKWQNVSSGNHNEYYGQTMPKQLGCGAGGVSCHIAGGVGPPNHTISEFCATCHGNFHTLTGPTSSGIGTGTKPFIRHPTDLALPNSGEYSTYNGDNTFSVEAPVARAGAVPDAVSAVVDPATGKEVVMCLSCHGVHATNYPDLLRWDYSQMIAAGGASNSGCFVCHTTKDD